MMHPYTTTGKKPNNNKFSSCSKESIKTVLRMMSNGQKKNCLTMTRARLMEDYVVRDSILSLNILGSGWFKKWLYSISNCIN